LSSKLETAEEFAKEIRKIKSSDIKKLANDIFQDNKLALAIIGKKVDSKSVGKVFKL
jgi:predicted Zn-dependent peptidase